MRDAGKAQLLEQKWPQKCVYPAWQSFLTMPNFALLQIRGGGGGGDGDVYGRINRAPGCGRTKNSFAVLGNLKLVRNIR